MPKELPFNLKLVLHQWITNLFGYNWLELGLERNDIDLLEPFVDLRSIEGGSGEDISILFSQHLCTILPPEAEISKDDVIRYGDNISRHTQYINAGRDQKIEWKYYQWLSLLFTEVYLHKFFSNPEGLCEQLNEYLLKHRKHWKEKGYKADLLSFARRDLNKICYQNATGSGKTLLMHVNILQFSEYTQRASHQTMGDTILITPNEDLSKQHVSELEKSGFAPRRLLADKRCDLSEGTDDGKCLVLFTEITKFSKEGIDPGSLGDQNLIMVDEGHRGLGSAEKNNGWFANRKQLAGNGFVFEYSATFKEAAAAAQKNSIIKDSYPKSILFDYSYGKFYKDGYGKGCRILNLPSTYQQLRFRYLTACLLSFYQQLRLYQDKGDEYAGYNLEKPLWVFVGSTVTKGRSNAGNNENTVSDVGSIICFLAQFISNRTKAEEAINQILKGEGQETGLLDKDGRDIFLGEFDYLKDCNVSELQNDIRTRLFLSASGAQLSLYRIRGSENEVLLSASGASNAFGIINIGDASRLLSHLETLEIDGLLFGKSASQKEKFSSINKSSSPINILIGSKRFVEGWDCWRVSTLGLMHVGKSEGAQIVQLFGRGVRLKGHALSLKRSEYSQPHKRKPAHIQYLETLNIFGIEAGYMETFKAFLEGEGVPERKEVFRINLNVTYDFGHNLLVLRPRKKTDCGREYDFNLDGASPTFGEIPPAIEEKKITVDWYARISTRNSSTTSPSKGKDKDDLKHKGNFREEYLYFLDEGQLFFQLEQHKLERGWDTLNIPKAGMIEILKNKNWYRLLVPKQTLSVVSASNIEIWQDLAAELLRKYADALYNYRKQEFLRTRLELRPITPKDANIPIDNAYEITVDASAKQLIKDIKELRDELQHKENEMVEKGKLKGCRLANHLYEPLLHYNKSSKSESHKIHIKPVSLVGSEIDFIGNLANFLKDGPKTVGDREISTSLLRNESRGKGMGFFEAGNFYPDFLLWIVSGDQQSLVFIEPHGLRHESQTSDKIEFHKTIKGIQARLDNEVHLHSFIISPTTPEELKKCWHEHNVQNANERNVYFMNDKRYLHKIYDKVINEMRRE